MMLEIRIQKGGNPFNGQLGLFDEVIRCEKGSEAHAKVWVRMLTELKPWEVYVDRLPPL